MTKMDLTVRKACRDDISALCELERQCFSLPWSAEAFGDFFDNGCSLCLVCEGDGDICGYIGANVIWGEVEITNLAVSENHRRIGVGELLITSLCAAEGIERVLLDVRESNTAARRLYEKCGFSVDGIRRGFYSKPREDAVLMSRNIK